MDESGGASHVLIHNQKGQVQMCAGLLSWAWQCGDVAMGLGGSHSHSEVEHTGPGSRREQQCVGGPSCNYIWAERDSGGARGGAPYSPHLGPAEFPHRQGP